MFVCDFFFFKQKTAYEMRISDWSSDVCSSDLPIVPPALRFRLTERPNPAKGARILRGGAASRGPFMFFTPTSGPLVPPHPSGLRRMCSPFEEQGHGQADDRQDQAGEPRRHGLFLCPEKKTAHTAPKKDGTEKK